MQVQTRNLRENQLGGVIFGCKHETMEECFSKQLFGLPSLHLSYVRNVKAGLPLFLFNYSDRKLHGVFEAASPGGNCIDPYAWSDDGTLRTPFPAQVRICTRTRYLPLLEGQYKKVLQDNYYTSHYFFFELDHAQTRALIALFKSLGPPNVKQVPAISSKRSLVVPLPSTKRVASVIPKQKKGTSNSKDINPFSVLSISSGIVPDDLVDSDADSGSISRTSDSNTDEKASGELVSDWEDLDDNDLQNQFGLCSNPDEVSQHSSYKTVAEGVEVMQCNQPVVDPVNEGSHTCDEDTLVNSHDDGTYGEVQNEPDGVGVQLETPSILKKLKELFVLRQQAALSSQDFVYSSPDGYVPEETQVNANLSSQDESVPEETLLNANLSSQDESVPEETLLNANLCSQDESASGETQFSASLSSQDESVPEETPVNAIPSQVEFVPEEKQINANLSCQDQHVPEETQANASLSTPDHYVPEETQAKSSLRLSNKPVCGTVEDNTCVQQHHGNAELLRIITDLTKKADALEKNQIKSDQEIISLKEVIKDSGRKVQQLEYRIDELQFKFDSSLSLQGSMCDNLDRPSIFLIGGYNGVTWLSSLDSFSPKKDILVPLTSMGSARSYASVAAMEGCIFVFGGGDGSSWYNTAECYNTRSNEWMICPCLNHEKGSLAGVSLDGKIYAMGGGDGSQTYSEVEMFDPFLGKWICSPSMLQPRFALAGAESSGVIYATGGYDGHKYLQSAERYDPREGFWVRLPSMNARRGCHAVAVLDDVLYAIGGYDGVSMVSSVEIFDPRLNAWKMGDPMSSPRGYASAVTLDDSLFVLGGLRSNEQILDTVEVYNVSSGWTVPGFSSIGKRSFASAIVM
ncbi:uncharacterized protein LOC100836442 [Brachypodium distachyon]|uniref:DCD domain-containing protein n=1 Tax=Brachypodium distachyon TaxID=15368 RepID=A0A0Q3K8V4_BRADI|nr:uncharacterized protein LOC100836442 [Brachypodium distachyon]XP_024314098.1 uncharacterized protein LOC100836442 [Brachypodium distachyon]KQK07321.1 hypothetical protein BRADI_2g34547v3 [Brachypodium distachyon]PNT71726.1 hypothetical protein BRADI_2g34547v3 [Brachypodium distachyon]PNT71727.1 hypothetical protein BRADI_2g34547v3 [Brachypodium distachyon]|eukprot:XP_003566504.1 uncharacterized protein LOC100836442 [Brachypodium distachyon]